MLLAGVSGAVAALGDTLYPSMSLADALAEDLSATSHVLIRLRLVHPVVAMTVGAALLFGSLRVGLACGGRARQLGFLVAALVVAQVVAGIVNVLLLAPVWLQLVHLLMADLLWIAFLLLVAQVLGREEQAARHRAVL
jgi:heme A synthase